MIVSYQDIQIFLVESDNQILESTHKGVEQEVKNWMQWEPESVTHIGKLVDGTGYDEIFLDELHIQRPTRVAVVVEDVIGIKNTSTSSGDFAEVTYTVIRLVVPDGTNEDDTTTLFADYATITLMVDQINTIGKGWTATVANSNFSSYASNTILPVDGLYVGTFDGATAQYGYLNIAGEPIPFIPFKERGMIKRSGVFPEGSQNIAINYVSGWLLADMPADLQYGIKRLVKVAFTKDAKEGTGVKMWSSGQISVTYIDEKGVSGSLIDRLIPYKYKKVSCCFQGINI